MVCKNTTFYLVDLLKIRATRKATIAGSTQPNLYEDNGMKYCTMANCSGGIIKARKSGILNTNVVPTTHLNTLGVAIVFGSTWSRIMTMVIG